MTYAENERRRKYGVSHYEKYKPYYVKKAKEWNKKYIERNKKFVSRVKLKFGCKQCGYKKHHQALEFHHTEGNEKDQAVAHLVRRSCSIKRLKQEIRKCIILCCRCHREEHIKLGEWG